VLLVGFGRSRLDGGQFEQFGSLVCSRFGSARSFAGGLDSSFWRQFGGSLMRGSRRRPLPDRVRRVLRKRRQGDEASLPAYGGAWPLVARAASAYVARQPSSSAKRACFSGVDLREDVADSTA
jgi:hypothetical protein